jgi:hypothetical protein
VTQSKFDAPPIRCTGLSRGRHPAELVYSLSTGVVTGLFGFSGGEEERILHGNEWRVSEPMCEPGAERIACVVSGKHGQSHIAIWRPGRGIEQVTEGDAQHTAPCWSTDGRVLFESRVFGYDKHGKVVDLAPATIAELDLLGGSVRTLIEHPEINCTSPRVSNDATVHYLRQPRPQAKSVPFWSVLLDALLFPFRLVFALLQYLNLFSLRYSGKPLLSSRNARAKQADVRRAAQIGNLVSAANEASDSEETQIPQSWVLVRRASDGQETIVAKSVLCFDVYPDGSALWSDGKRVTYVSRDGKATVLGKFGDVGEVLALEQSDGVGTASL